jgi:hypothetical protein
MKSDSWSEHSQDLLQLSGSDQTLSDVSLAHIFRWRPRRKSLAYAPLRPTKLAKRKSYFASLVTNDLRLSSDAFSGLPEVFPPSHPVLLLPTRSFF